MDPLVRTARLTGLFYLGLAITGLFGFLLIRPRLFDADNPAATLANLTTHESLARVGVAFELGIVLTQALAAAWFYRLFRRADAAAGTGTAAAGIAAFGLVNSAAILGSAALLGTAVTVANEPIGTDTAATVQLLYLISGNLWFAGNLFFGLWLIPMGVCVLRSRWMPRPLGWILVAGGVGYILNGFVTFLAPDSAISGDLLAMPASVGEFWMVGYLLIRGVRRTAIPAAPAASLATADA